MIKENRYKQKKTKYKYSKITEKIIESTFNVYNTLGYGFLEKVYENALIVELRNKKLNVEAQKPIKVFYKDKLVGEYIVDIIVEGKVIVEVKSVNSLNKIHEVQLVNYLKATKLEVGLLINFGEEMKIKRKIFDL